MMDRRRFIQFCMAGAVAPSLLAIPPRSVEAQGRPRSAATQQQSERAQRPVGKPLRVQPPSAEVMQILRDWEVASGKFSKLQGEHYRWVYDFVFMSEKRSKGKFWFASPDMGRIDLEPWENKDNPRAAGKDGKPLPGGKPFAVEPDKQDQWVSNGKEIIQVNTKQKSVEVFPIPKQIQGQGITDSPLPFLFGMKANKAAVRYTLKEGKFNNPRAGRIHLIAYPNLAQDARNWSRAEIMLDGKTFYPQAIKMIDPGGNSETVYKFFNVGQPSFWNKAFGNDPFAINTPRGFRRVVHNAPEAKEKVAQNGQFKMPRLIGQHWKQTKAILEKAGYEVKLKQGDPAPNQALVYHIYQQIPAPSAPLDKKQPIVLTLYTQSKNRAAAKPPARGARRN